MAEERKIVPGQRTWWHLALLAALAGPLFFAGQAGRSYWLCDEPFVAEVSREMAASGDWLIPRLNGRPFLEKPPLHYDLVATSFRLLGETPFAARLPSALAGLLTAVAIYALGRMLLGRREGFFAALLFPVLYLPFYLAHYTLVDASLVLFVTAGLAAATFAWKHSSSWAVTATWAFAGLAYLAKGPVGPVLLGTGLAAFALAEGRKDMLSPRRHMAGMAVLVCMVIPWWLALWAEGGWPFLRESLLVNTLGRAFAFPSMVPAHDTLGTHAAPIYDYLGGLLGDFLPWTPSLLLALVPALAGTVGPLLRQRKEDGDDEGLPAGVRFLAWSFLAGFVLLSLAHSKRSMYLAPLFPSLALIVAWRLVNLGTRPLRRWERALMATQAAVLGIFLLAVPAAGIYLQGAREWRNLPAGTWALMGLVWAGALGAGWFSLRWTRQARLERLPFLFWGEAAAGFMALVVLCFPAMERQKSFRAFFEEARAMETARKSVPRLFTPNESYVGLAGLYFGRTLPPLEGPVPATELDVLTDKDGLRVLPPRRMEVLLSEEISGPGQRRGLYLAHIGPKGTGLPQGTPVLEPMAEDRPRKSALIRQPPGWTSAARWSMLAAEGTGQPRRGDLPRKVRTP